MDVGTTAADEYREPSVQEKRFERMKLLRIERVTFADMVPLFIADGLIPEHENHRALLTVKQGRRTQERNETVCSRCEHLIHQQWKRNVSLLSADEAVLYEARFIWTNYALKRIVKYEQLAIAPIVTETVVRRKIEAKEETENDDYVIETTTRTEHRTTPAYFKMADDLAAQVARLAGVPVGDLSSVPKPGAEGRDRKKVSYFERSDGDEQQPEPTN